MQGPSPSTDIDFQINFFLLFVFQTASRHTINMQKLWPNLFGDAIAHRKYGMNMACRYFIDWQSLIATLAAFKRLFLFSGNLSVSMLGTKPDPPILEHHGMIVRIPIL